VGLVSEVTAMRTAGLCRSAALPFLLLVSEAHAQGGAPLDVSDPTPRNVFVQVEQSASLGTVGQTFGPAFPATYSASGNTGTLTVSAATHEQMRTQGTSFLPVPDTFTPIAVQIDLTNLEATSPMAGGVMSDGALVLSFSQNMLGTTTTAGYMGPSAPPLFCTSQAEVDMACMFFPIFCGQSCILVPGDAYDPGTGKVNLVGRETQTGCDGSFCDGPFDFFTQRGDLRLTEAAEVPALPGLAPFALLGLLAAGARVLRRS
jgi:hypothetical protein